MSDSEKYITVLEGDQLAVAAKALSGSIISEPSKRYITALVQTDEGVQLAVKAYVLNGGGGGGGDVDYTKIVQKTSSMPAASASNAGYVYMYQGSTNQTYTHGYIYENQYVANYAGTIAFTPAGISVSDEDFSSFLNTWKQYLTTPTLVTNGTITYYADADLWRMVMKDASNQQIGTLQLYQEDYEDSGFTFPVNSQDGDTYSFTTTITEASSSYQWVRLDVQPSNSDVYVLPPATADTLGGIKVGENLTVEADGTLNATGGGNTFSEASLSMPTGTQALSDPDLYNYIKTMYDASTKTGSYVNATKVGSISISSTGAVTNFSSSNYLSLPANFFRPGNNPWKIEFTIKPGALVSASALSFNKLTSDSDPSFGILFKLNASGSVNWQVMSAANTYLLDETVQGILQVGTDVTLGLEFTGTVYNGYVNGEIVCTSSSSSSVYQSNTSVNVIGKRGGSAEQPFTDGTFYLPTLVISISGKKIFQGAYIEYKKIATGSNVADISQKSSIDALAATSGSALFYTIDTTNQTITLPKGDLFGFITQAIEKGE